MRFLKLDLRAFGSFAHAPPIRFGDGGGLHLVLGPNEAGKSTALRAIRRLLFGFPLQAGDNHLHKYDDLRIGATIRGEDGRELSFVRHRNGIHKLWEFDDSRPIDDRALSPYLGSMDEPRFVDLFSMDHAELVDGGKAILKGGGRTGELLFAAGTGLAGIDRVREAIEAEADALFKPRAAKPLINAALAELESAKAKAEGSMLYTSAWVELDATLARELASREAIDAEIQSAEAEKRRLERLRDALPVIARRAVVLGRLAELGDAPVLADGFADRCHHATVDRKVGINTSLAAEMALEAAEKKLADFGPRAAVLDEADAICRVRDDLSDYLKALKGRPAEQGRLALKEADARALLAELRPGIPLGEADGLRLPAGLKEQVQALDKELAGLDDRRSAAEGEVAKLATGPETSGPAPGPDAVRLARTLDDEVARAQGLGDLDGLLATARLELAKAERQAGVDLDRLPLWAGSLDDLEAMKAPSTATLNRFAAEFQAADQKLDRARDALAGAVAKRSELDRELDRERLAGAIPTEEELADRRARRDDGWRTIRRGWLEGEPVEGPAGVADDFETAVRSADDIADRLRREADAVAEQAQRKLRRLELLDEIATLVDARDLADRERAATRQAWGDLWKPIGLDPLPPGEMKDWVAIHRAELIRQAKGLRDRRAEIADQAMKVEEIKAELTRHLAGLGEVVVGPPGSLAGLLARSKAAVDRVGAALQLETARVKRAKAEAARDDWNARWASTVGPLGLLGDASPTRALKVISRFDDLASLLREINEVRSKIEDHARVEARFRADVRSLVDRIAPDLSGAPVEAAARQLIDRLDGATVVEVRREEILEHRKDERAKLDEAKAAVDLSGLTLAALVAEAGCAAPDDLIAAVRVSDEVKGLKKELHGFDKQLAEMAGSVPPEELRGQAVGADPDAIEAEIARLTDQLAARKVERDRLVEEIVRCRENLKRMDGGPAAADAQQAVEEQAAHLTLDVERYARLRLASAVLREAVESYRKAHERPVLKRAEDLFASLTVGSFAGLRAELDDTGQPVLLGVRPDGTTLKAEGMSEGTADQLYLALRLASLRTYLDAHEPMPLVVDDILVNFDNARALAALKALAELSRETQVLFFTHHDHLVDLARSALGDDVLFVHRLDYPPVSVNGHAEGSPVEAAKPKRKKKGATAMADEG